MKIKKITRSILALFCVLAASAQSHTQSLLWEISGNGLSAPSYLAGTFHTMCAEDFLMKEKVKTALGKTKNLVLEINYTDSGEVEALQKMMSAEQPLSAQLDAESLKRLENILVQYGTSLKEVDSFSPQALYSLVSKKSFTCAPADLRMYEIELIKLAMGNGARIGGLETVETQAKYLGLAYNLHQTIEQLEAGDSYAAITKDMIKAFQDENLEELTRMVRDRRFMNDEQEKWVLTERNRNWARSMPDMMKKESTFFAVGGGHLGGNNGVIKLLQDLGYTLKPVIL